MNNDFWVTREAICQWFSLVTSSLVKIIGKSPHEWPKRRFANDFHSWKLLANRLTSDPKIVIHGNECIILYISISNTLEILQSCTKRSRWLLFSWIRRYSRLLFTSEDRLCANLRVQEQSTNMTSQCQCPTFAWRHRSTVETHNTKSEKTVLSDNGEISDR